MVTDAFKAFGPHDIVNYAALITVVISRSLKLFVQHGRISHRVISKY